MMAGTPRNCAAMLEAGECVMVFPEGARGANKPWRKRYQLQHFGLGFMRLALETNTPIVPVGIVGAEEQQPGFANLEGLGKRLGLPSSPDHDQLAVAGSARPELRAAREVPHLLRRAAALRRHGPTTRMR